VRGTPQQIIEKYQMLARDAQLSNDRVAAENFLQHAEHYTRMLGRGAARDGRRARGAPGSSRTAIATSNREATIASAMTGATGTTGTTAAIIAATTRLPWPR
jgi:hypothetical protein